MFKKYKSISNSLSILVSVGGEVRNVDFEWDIVDTTGRRGCSFSTDDIELQKALERHEYFRRKLRPSFWTDDVDDNVSEGESVNLKGEVTERKSVPHSIRRK